MITDHEEMHVSHVAKIIGTNNLSLNSLFHFLLVVVAAASRRIGPFPIGLLPRFVGATGRTNAPLPNRAPASFRRSHWRDERALSLDENSPSFL